MKFNLTFKDILLVLGCPILCFVMIDCFSGQNAQISIWDSLKFVPINILFFAFPQLVWFIMMRLTKSSRSVNYGGLIGVNIVLLSMGIFILLIQDGEIAWIYYYPCASIAFFVGGLIGRILNKRRTKMFDE